MKPMLSPAQCAARLGFNVATVIRYIKRGDLKAAKIGRWRVDPDDLEAFIAQNKQTAVAPPLAVCDVPPHQRFA